MSLLTELTRRKVLKVGAAYLVVAWLAVQAASIGFPAFDAPPWSLRIFILVALLGFPVVLVLTWVVDLTPDGVKFDADLTGSKRVFAAAALLIVLALGWYSYGQPSFRKGDEATPVVADDNSLAVLPFANMSGEADQEYFSDGMTEELLNVLAKVPQLKVVARTSVFQFKGKGGDVREIGRKLGVTHIVEGSVRRDGEQVRVTAQLVRVADGFHVWSETYDRKLEGVFALQDDIAKHIGEALEKSLGVTASVTARAPVDPQAYDEYLKGRALHRQRKDLASAIMHFKAAVAKAPEFAAAWSSLSLAYEVSFWYPASRTAEYQAEMLAGEQTAAERAAALEPNAAATEHALGNVATASDAGGAVGGSSTGYIIQIPSPVLPASFYREHSGHHLPIGECIRQGGEAVALVNALPRVGSSAELQRSVIIGQEIALIVNRQCEQVPGAVAELQQNLQTHAQAIINCQQLASSPAMCLAPYRP